MFAMFRIRFGSSNLYIFRHPSVAEEASRQHRNITLFMYEDAQEEIARNSGLDFSNGSLLLFSLHAFYICRFYLLVVIVSLRIIITYSFNRVTSTTFSKTNMKMHFC